MKGSKRGIWLVIGMFIVGGCALAGLFLSPRHPSTLPKDAQPGVPSRKLRIVSYNVHKNLAGREKIERELLAANADFLLLQELPTDQAKDVARNLKMNLAFLPHPNLKTEGVGILSPHPLDEVVGVPDPAGRMCAVFADTAVDGRRFLVVSVHLQSTWQATIANAMETERIRQDEWELIRRKWMQRKRPAVIIGGDSNQLPGGPNYLAMTDGFTDALAHLGKTEYTVRGERLSARVDYFLVPPEWNIAAGGIIDSTASDHRPIWVEVTGE